MTGAPTWKEYLLHVCLSCDAGTTSSSSSAPTDSLACLSRSMAPPPPMAPPMPPPMAPPAIALFFVDRFNIAQEPEIASRCDEEYRRTVSINTQRAGHHGWYRTISRLFLIHTRTVSGSGVTADASPKAACGFFASPPLSARADCKNGLSVVLSFTTLASCWLSINAPTPSGDGGATP
jgi:hypothetical protein